MVELERGEGKRKENMVFPMFGCFDRKEMIQKWKEIKSIGPTLFYPPKLGWMKRKLQLKIPVANFDFQ